MIIITAIPLFASSLIMLYHTAYRDTIHIEGVKLGFDRPVFFDRHAVGGEYGAGWKSVGAGRLVTTFFGDVSTVQMLALQEYVTFIIELIYLLIFPLIIFFSLYSYSYSYY